MPMGPGDVDVVVVTPPGVDTLPVDVALGLGATWKLA